MKGASFVRSHDERTFLEDHAVVNRAYRHGRCANVNYKRCRLSTGKSLLIRQLRLTSHQRLLAPTQPIHRFDLGRTPGIPNPPLPTLLTFRGS